MRFKFRGDAFETRVWRPSMGRVGELVALDTETEAIEPGKVPRLVLAQAYSGGGVVYFIQNKTLARFLDAHHTIHLVFHNAPFDLAVMEATTNTDFHDAIVNKRIWDTGLLFRLWKLATVGGVPETWGLAAASKELLAVDLDKNEALRTGFGQYFRPDDSVDYQSIPATALCYAAVDAVACFQLFELLMPAVEVLDPEQHMSHQIQLLGAIGLHPLGLNGIGVDLDQRARLLADIEKKLSAAKVPLAGLGYVPGKKGVRAVGQYRLRQLEVELGIPLPKTATMLISTRAENLAPYTDRSPFIDALVKFKGLEKLHGFVTKLDKPRVYARFNVLVNTGRTSCSRPNLQNQPRASGVRECFIPASGYCFLIIDYSQIELCALAQICLDRYGAGKMAELLNAGVDLHRWFAGILLNKEPSSVTAAERQTAKACNFGFPGGLGIRAFIEYARSTYGITDLSEERAKSYRERWLDTFPEMRRYLADDSLGRVMEAYNFSLATEALGFDCDAETAAKIFLRIVGGHDENTHGRPYSERTMEWALGEVAPSLNPKLAGIKSGSPEIRKDLLRSSVQTRSGRIRARCNYTQARNTPFQGLAADGAKIALYELQRSGFRVVNFIHDEFIIEVPLDANRDVIGPAVAALLVGAMREMVPDVLVKTEWFFADRWYKSGKQVRANGHIAIFSEPGPAAHFENLGSGQDEGHA